MCARSPNNKRQKKDGSYKCFKTPHIHFLDFILIIQWCPFFRIDTLIGKNGELYIEEGGLLDKKGGVGELLCVHSEAGMWAMAVNSHIWFHVVPWTSREREGKQTPVSPSCLLQMIKSPVSFRVCVTYLYDTNNKSLLIHIGWKNSNLSVGEKFRHISAVRFSAELHKFYHFELYNITKY